MNITAVRLWRYRPSQQKPSGSGAAARKDHPRLFRNLNALPISMVEFPLVARDYPIVFVTADSGKSYAVFAVLGLETQSNLFLMSDNTWDRRSYLPAYVRRYPFCMATITVDGKMRDERLVCVEKKALRRQRRRNVRRARQAAARVGSAAKAADRVRSRPPSHQRDGRACCGARGARTLHDAGEAQPGCRSRCRAWRA